MEHLSFDEKDPNADFPKAIANAKAKYKSSNYKKAIVDLNKAIKIQPKYANSYLLRGMCKAKLENLKGACRDWKKADKLGSRKAKNFINTYCSKTLDKENDNHFELSVNDSNTFSISEHLDELAEKNNEFLEKMYEQEGEPMPQWFWGVCAIIMIIILYIIGAKPFS